MGRLRVNDLVAAPNQVSLLQQTSLAHVLHCRSCSRVMLDVVAPPMPAYCLSACLYLLIRVSLACCCDDLHLLHICVLPPPFQP